MTGTDTAAMVDVKYDVVIDGYGYMFWAGLMQSLPFRNQRAAYALSPTFIERSNVSGSYGDNEQDFFLTVSQNDWSEGSLERYYRGNDPDRSRKYFAGSAIDTSIAGQVTMRRASQSITAAGTIFAACYAGVGVGISAAYVTSANLYTVGETGSVTSFSAHGAGVPNRWGICNDLNGIYIAGATSIRRFDGSAHTFSTFSAHANMQSLAFLNNALYSCDGSVLYVYDSSGTRSAVFPWKDASGNAYPANGAKLLPFGGSLLIMIPQVSTTEVWEYDGTSTFKILELPASAIGFDMHQFSGVVFISAVVEDSPGNSALGVVPVIYTYVNGSLDELWRSPKSVGTPSTDMVANSQYSPSLGNFAGKVVFTNPVDGTLNEYDLKLGAVTTIGAYTGGGGGLVSTVATSPRFVFVFGSGSSAASIYPDSANFASAATVDSGLIDFDNSLTKTLRGVKVEWVGGGTVDISYQLDSLTGSYTSLHTSVTSGLEYLFPAGTQARAVSVRVTLNNSAGSLPTLTRVYVRAAPVQQSYRRCQYVLDLGGSPLGGVYTTRESNPVQLRDGTSQYLNGFQAANNLGVAIKATVPVVVTDSFGTYTAVFEQGPGVTEIDETRPGEYIAQVTLREV